MQPNAKLRNENYDNVSRDLTLQFYRNIIRVTHQVEYNGRSGVIVVINVAIEIGQTSSDLGLFQ